MKIYWLKIDDGENTTIKILTPHQLERVDVTTVKVGDTLISTRDDIWQISTGIDCQHLRGTEMCHCEVPADCPQLSRKLISGSWCHELRVILSNLNDGVETPE